jgi:hypothetical protein
MQQGIREQRSKVEMIFVSDASLHRFSWRLFVVAATRSLLPRTREREMMLFVV